MKNVIIVAAKLYFEIVAFFRQYIWNSFKKRSKTFHKLFLDKNKFYYFNQEGDIPKILYSRMPMRHVGKSFEYRTMGQFLKYIKEDFTVIDIGANIGLYTLLLSDLVGERGQVFSIEPSSNTYKILGLNIEYNKCVNVKPFKLAISDRAGMLSLETPEEAKGKYEDSFKMLNLKGESGSNDSEMVETKTLDSFISDNLIEKVDFIKIDVEGSELLIFKGAENLLKSANRPIILFECAEELAAQFDVSVADSVFLLKQHGYNLIQYEYNQWLALPY